MRRKVFEYKTTVTISLSKEIHTIARDSDEAVDDFEKKCRELHREWEAVASRHGFQISVDTPEEFQEGGEIDPPGQEPDAYVVSDFD